MPAPWRSPAGGTSTTPCGFARFPGARIGLTRSPASAPMPHIGLNLVFLVPGETGGMEVYARNLIESLVKVRSDLRLTAFINRNAAEAPGPWHDLEHVTVPVDSRSRVKWVLGEQLLLPPIA